VIADVSVEKTGGTFRDHTKRTLFDAIAILVPERLGLVLNWKRIHSWKGLLKRAFY
jgi:hypothetical protein